MARISRKLASVAAYAAAAVFAGLYFFQSSTLGPNHTDEGFLLQCVEDMAHGRRPYFDFADAYGLLNWVFPVAFYKWFGYRVWGIRIWMLLLKVFTVFTAYVLVRKLTDDPGGDRTARTRGPLYAAFAFIGTTVLLGAQWQSLETPYAFITVMPLTLGAWYFLLAPPGRKPHMTVIDAGGGEADVLGPAAVLRLPARSLSSSSKAREDAPNAAQCSRSTAWRSRSPAGRRRLPQAPAHTASFHASREWMGCGSSSGRDVASTR